MTVVQSARIQSAGPDMVVSALGAVIPARAAARQTIARVLRNE
ncbi:hypothetical protein [Streptomyces sp. NPDC096311]